MLPQCWDYKPTPPSLAFSHVLRGIELKASVLLTEPSPPSPESLISVRLFFSSLVTDEEAERSSGSQMTLLLDALTVSDELGQHDLVQPQCGWTLRP